jgi:4'-phosphopantetheinyl transferase
VTVRPRTRTPLRQGDIHLWRIELDAADAAECEAATALLAPDERSRAARFHFERDRRRYIVGRAFVRTVLSTYTGTSASDVCFRYSAYGKPALEEPEEVSFNLAHAGGTGLLAIARAELGVDLEPAHGGTDDELIARSFFSAAEVEALRALPHEERRQAFLRCWTRKEAFLKATGDGLTVPLHHFEVTLAPNEPAALRWTAWSRSEPRSWRLLDVSWACPGHIAALALRADAHRIVAYDSQKASITAQSNGKRKENGNGSI